MKTETRRQNLRDALIAAAERAIAAHGLAGVKARDLAAQAGCAVGAIYNAVTDLDELVFAVNGRTLAALERSLDDAAQPARRAAASAADAATARLVQLAVAYLEFVAANTPRWRAVFEHRLPEGRMAPDWYVAEQSRLFTYIEAPLRDLQPDLAAGQHALAARTLFSAVHGIVTLGLEEKLGVVPLAMLRAQIEIFVAALAGGLIATRRR